MRDDDQNPSPLAHAQNRLRERFVAFHVEVRIRLVEHDQERVATERPREPDALALPGRQRRPAFSDLRFIPVGKAEDQFVHAGGFCCRDDRHRVVVRIEARDVLRHRSGEELHVLRQIPDMTAELLG